MDREVGSGNADKEVPLPASLVAGEFGSAATRVSSRCSGRRGSDSLLIRENEDDFVGEDSADASFLVKT